MADDKKSDKKPKVKEYLLRRRYVEANGKIHMKGSILEFEEGKQPSTAIDVGEEERKKSDIAMPLRGGMAIDDTLKALAGSEDNAADTATKGDTLKDLEEAAKKQAEAEEKKRISPNAVSSNPDDKQTVVSNSPKAADPAKIKKG